jgi:hypothetical protein
MQIGMFIGYIILLLFAVSPLPAPSKQTLRNNATETIVKNVSLTRSSLSRLLGHTKQHTHEHDLDFAEHQPLADYHPDICHSASCKSV